MSKVYLFSDITDQFSVSLAKKCSENEDIVCAINEEPLTANHSDSVSYRNIKIFPGKVGSSLSTVACFRKVVNLYDRVDNIFIFGHPVQESFSLQDSGKLYFETLVDQKIKNMMFFLGEAIKLLQEKKSESIVFVDRFALGEQNVANALWKGSFYSMAEWFCRKNSLSFNAEWYQLKNEKNEQAISFVLECVRSEEKSFPSIMVLDERKSHGLFRF